MAFITTLHPYHHRSFDFPSFPYKISIAGGTELSAPPLQPGLNQTGIKYLSNRALLPTWPHLNTRGFGESETGKPSTASRVCISLENFPNPM